MDIKLIEAYFCGHNINVEVYCCLPTLGIYNLTHERMFSVTIRRILTFKSPKILLVCPSVMFLAFITIMHMLPQKRQTLRFQDEQCKLSQTWRRYTATTELNATDWSFNTRVQCPEFNPSNYLSTRKLIVLQCKRNTTPCITETDSNDTNVFEIPFGDTCLIDAIDLCCKDRFVVENIVHYVWFGNQTMTFFHFLSFMSTVNFIKPCLILIAGTTLPYGMYWDYFLRVFPNVIHVKRSRPTAVGGNKLAYVEHGSDVMRIEALQGGYRYFYVVGLN